MSGGEVPADEQERVLAVVVSATGTVELHRGPAFDAERAEHADLAADVAAAVRRVLDAYAVAGPGGGEGGP